jgi:hypothetical protein
MYMNSDFKSLINKYIAELDGYGSNFVIPRVDIDDVLKQLKPPEVYDYINYGGECPLILFDRESNEVVKLCNKFVSKPEQVIRKTTESIDQFRTSVRALTDAGVEILEPTRYIYENDSFLLYAQPRVACVQRASKSLILFIVQNLKRMIINNCYCPDLFVNNIGIQDDGTFCIFDFHDICEFSRYINNAAQMFNYFMFANGAEIYHWFNDTREDFELAVYKKFNAGEMSLREADFLIALNEMFIYEKPAFNKDDVSKSMIVLKIDSLIAELEDHVSSTTKRIDNYQSIVLRDGEVMLSSHTLKKFKYVNDLIRFAGARNIISVVDYGCAFGGIGMCVAKRFPSMQVSMFNIDAGEVDVCKEMIEFLKLGNAHACLQNVVNSDEQYDITLYFALLHHVLKSKSMAEVVNMISQQTLKYAIIEVPIGNDALLGIVKTNAALDYDCSFKYLETVESFADMFKSRFELMKSEKIEYPNSPDLNRYVFVFQRTF